MMHEANILSIRELLLSIARQLDISPKSKSSNDTKELASKLLTILSYGNNGAERFYFIYLICQLCSNSKPNRAEELIKILFPTQRTTESLKLLSDLVSFALCHPPTYKHILDELSFHPDISDVDLDVESWHQAESLALDSPSICSAILSRKDLPRMNIDKKLLAKWLQDLSRIEQEFPKVKLDLLIKYSLSPEDAPTRATAEEKHIIDLANSDFHFGILTLIQCKKCEKLRIQSLIEVTSTLAQQVGSSEQKSKATTLVDRFAQILSVAAASEIITITNALRNALSKLDSNQLIASVIQWQNK